MKKQHHRKTDEATIQERMREHHKLREKVYDVDNKMVVSFNKLYKVFAIIFCIFLFLLLAWNVSYLPPLGAADKAVNNEVPKRYIESGIEETGAINFVTGMILDYRAFDTLGESNVLFCATITVLILLQITDKKKKKTDEDMIFEARLREFEQKEREFAITQNKLEASKVLANRNLPVEFVDYIVADDAETMMANIETFERAFKAAETMNVPE